MLWKYIGFDVGRFVSAFLNNMFDWSGFDVQSVPEENRNPGHCIFQKHNGHTLR